MTDNPFHCYRCGKHIQRFFYLEVLKRGIPHSEDRADLPQEAVVCEGCHNAHPECEYADSVPRTDGLVASRE